MVRTISLEGDERTTWVSLYAPCNNSDAAPLFYEALAALERRLNVSAHHQVLMAGDFNATALDRQRQNYKTKIFESDALFRKFANDSELRIIPGNESTWYSAMHPCHAVLDPATRSLKCEQGKVQNNNLKTKPILVPRRRRTT